MGNPYRDGGGSLEARLVAIEEAIAEREAALSEDFWRLAAPSLALDPPVPAKKRRKAKPMADVAELVALRQARLEKLEGAAARLDDLEAYYRQPPPTTPRCERKTVDSVVLLMTPPEATAARKEFVRVAKTLFPEGHLEEAGTFAMALSCARGATPIEAMCDAGFVSTGQGGSALEIRVVAQTSVSTLAGPLDVRPQQIGDEVLGLFGLRKEHTLGDADFDGMFFVRGDEAAARAILTEEIRAALLVIAKEGVPTLAVGNGLARIEWSYEPRLPAIEAALQILTALRKSKPTRSLRTQA